MTIMNAQSIARHSHEDPIDHLTLSYEERFLRRKVLKTDGGQDVLVDLEHTTSLNHGDAFVLAGGEHIAVVAATEPLIEITAGDLTPIAWHIGNRHTPCQIETGRLLIQPDHVIEALMEKLGATVTQVTEPFNPEGGAYGHGRTHGHDHSHDHGPVSGPDHDH